VVKRPVAMPWRGVVQTRVSTRTGLARRHLGIRESSVHILRREFFLSPTINGALSRPGKIVDLETDILERVNAARRKPWLVEKCRRAKLMGS
jgi:hypothetical protein